MPATLDTVEVDAACEVFRPPGDGVAARRFALIDRFLDKLPHRVVDRERDLARLGERVGNGGGWIEWIRMVGKCDFPWRYIAFHEDGGPVEPVAEGDDPGGDDPFGDGDNGGGEEPQDGGDGDPFGDDEDPFG